MAIPTTTAATVAIVAPIAHKRFLRGLTGVLMGIRRRTTCRIRHIGMQSTRYFPCQSPEDLWYPHYPEATSGSRSTQVDLWHCGQEAFRGQTREQKHAGRKVRPKNS